MVLYHGSRVLVPRREPGPDGFFYATHIRAFALQFALPVIAEAGKRHRVIASHDAAGNPRLVIEHGRVDVDGIGYLYEVDSDGFEERRYQWLIQRPVIPLRVHELRGRDFLSWIA